MKPEDLVVGEIYKLGDNQLLFIGAVEYRYAELGKFSYEYRFYNYGNNALEDVTEVKIWDITSLEQKNPPVKEPLTTEPTVREFRTVEGYPIEIGKAYQTRNGEKVWIRGFNDSKTLPILGLWDDTPCSWGERGKYNVTGTSYYLDLMRPWPEEKDNSFTEDEIFEAACKEPGNFSKEYKWPEEKKKSLIQENYEQDHVYREQIDKMMKKNNCWLCAVSSPGKRDQCIQCGYIPGGMPRTQEKRSTEKQCAENAHSEPVTNCDQLQLKEPVPTLKAHDPSKMWVLWVTDSGSEKRLTQFFYQTKEEALQIVRDGFPGYYNIKAYALVQGILTEFDEGDGLND